MRYKEVLNRDHTEIEMWLQSTDPSRITDALLSAAYYDSDWRWVQQECLAFLNHENRNIRAVSATCLGHLARIHKQLDLELVLPPLTALKNDPDIGGFVQDALDDIKFFLRFQ